MELLPAAGALERLAERSGVELPNLAGARARTATRLDELRDRAKALPADPDAAVALMGSWGRGEVVAGSDADWIVLVDGAAREAVAPSADALDRLLDRGPTEDGPFGRVAARDDLVGRIGLDDERNRDLTLRLLLLLESAPLLGAGAWRSVRVALLDAYLGHGAKDHRPPRFLLNDVVRYWRTIAVDFEGKRRRGREGWGLRNLKLRTSRKLLFAGGLLPVLQCHSMTVAEMRDFLAAELEAPPTDRLAAAFLRHGAVDAGARTLGAYDTVLGALGDPAARDELAGLGSPEEAAGSELFDSLRRSATDLQAGLSTLLFDADRRLYGVTREYVVF